MNRTTPILAFLLVIALLCACVEFAAIVLVDRYHRAHPSLKAVLPNAYEDIAPEQSTIWPCPAGHTDCK